MGTPITKKVTVDVYKYQQELDLYADLKPELNVNNEQYTMHVDAIKDQGVDGHKVVDEVIAEWNHNDKPEGFDAPILTTVGDQNYIAWKHTDGTGIDFGTTHKIHLYVPANIVIQAQLTYASAATGNGPTVYNGRAVAGQANDMDSVANPAAAGGYGTYLTLMVMDLSTGAPQPLSDELFKQFRLDIVEA